MANLNLPSHDSSPVFIFSYLSPVHGENIPCSRQSPELSAHVAGMAQLEMVPDAVGGPAGCMALVPADLGQRGTTPSTV